MDASKPPPQRIVFDPHYWFLLASRLTALLSLCCVTLVFAKQGVTKLGLWNLLIPLLVLLGFKPWRLFASGFHPAGLLHLAFGLTAVATIAVPHLMIQPGSDLSLQGGNHLAAAFVVLPAAAAFYGLVALAVSVTLRFFIRRCISSVAATHP
jgi:hypothetical protein